MEKIKVKIEKQNGKEVEFVKETELQLLLKIIDILEIDNKKYKVTSIRQSTDCFVITVKDKTISGFKGLQYL